MRDAINRLLKGHKDVVDHFSDANKKRKELFESKRDAPVAEWADWLFSNQISFFEDQCGGRFRGQEIMEWSGFAAAL